MDNNFDSDKAKKFLESRDLEEKEQRELDRKSTLAIVIDSVKNLFSSTGVEVYLIGSITRPYMFHPHSDVDIAVKNFKGDRFDLWTKLESMTNRNVEIIIFETCPFQEHIIKNGYKVL